jgi:hypothetical protein
MNISGPLYMLEKHEIKRIEEYNKKATEDAKTNGYEPLLIVIEEHIDGLEYLCIEELIKQFELLNETRFKFAVNEYNLQTLKDRK